jgi:putative heme-binding domain-containing protein
LAERFGALYRPVLMLDGSEAAWAQTGVTIDGAMSVETWLRLEPGITNADGILGVPGVFDVNFHDGRFRVWAGSLSDVAIAKKPMIPEVWTHVAAVRDSNGKWTLYIDGELDAAGTKAAPGRLENLRVAWTNAGGGTKGALAEYRIWKRALSAEEIRTGFDRSVPTEERPAELIFHATGGGAWGELQAGARVAKTSDGAPILSAKEATEMDAKLAKYRALALQPGDPERGRTFATVCTACHLIGNTGGKIGPNLSGVGAMGTEAILRNLLMPNAAMENAYRTYRVEMKDGNMREGFLAAEDKDAIVLRLVGSEDQRIPRKDVAAAKFLRRSLMPEGLLEGMTETQVRDLFAYLLTLK